MFPIFFVNYFVSLIVLDLKSRPTARSFSIFLNKLRFRRPGRETLCKPSIYYAVDLNVWRTTVL